MYARTEDQRGYKDYPTYDAPDNSYPYGDQNRQSYYKPNEPYTPYVDPATLPAPTPERQRSVLYQLFNGKQKYAWFCWTVSIVQISVLICEFIRNGQATGSPIEIHPTFNPLIGPSPYVFPYSITNPDNDQHGRAICTLYAHHPRHHQYNNTSLALSQ